MNKKTWVIIVIVLVVILVGGYFVWAMYYSSPAYITPTINTPSQPATNNVVVPPSNNGAIQTLPTSGEQNVNTPTPAPVPAPTSTPTPTPKPNPVPAPSSAKTYTVNIQNFAFSPASISINVGDTIVWTNYDSAPHQIAGNGLSSSPLSNGQSYSFKFSSAGTYSYHCAIHPSMTGSIIVK